MINSSSCDLFCNRRNNNLCSENFEIFWSKYESKYLVKKSVSFKEASLPIKRERLLDSDDNTRPPPKLTDDVGELFTSWSCPDRLCYYSETRACERLPNADVRCVLLNRRGVRSFFCPVDVCARCQDSAVTLNNRGACQCAETSASSCPHEALWSTCDNRPPSDTLQQGYRWSLTRCSYSNDIYTR